MRVAQKLLVASLICLPTAAFADAYTLYPPPDLFIDTISVTSASASMQNVAFNATVEFITDQITGGCSSGCGAGLTFSQSGGAFSITGGGITYLTGTLTSFIIGAGGEVGEIFKVGIDNVAAWTALESAFLGVTNPASGFGGSVVIDLHEFDPNAVGPSDADADLTPSPEPASLTLVLAGLAAGLVRKRLARKKS